VKTSQFFVVDTMRVRTFNQIMAVITIIILGAIALFIMENPFEYFVIALLCLIYLEAVRKPDLET
jgi:hypothetical protein